MRRSFLPAMLSLSVLLSTIVAAYAASYTFATIDIPSGVNDTYAFGINNHGQIVGYYSTSGSSAFGFHGFLYDQGVFITLDPPGAIGGSFAFGINDYGQVVGHYYSDSQSLKSHGFLYDQGVFTTIDVPGAFSTYVYGINNDGQIVGHYSTIYEGDHGFAYDAGTFTTIDVPGATATGPRGINNHGQISGFYNSGGRPYGFLYDQGVFTTIDVPSFSFTVGFGINDYKQIAGYYYDSSDRVNYGFLYAQGVFTKLHPPGAFDTATYGINNDSQIVGNYTDSSSVIHNFVASPVPEPPAMDITPPVISVSVSPETLWPPNGKRVAVTVSGTITDAPGGLGVKAGSAAYVIMDEYGQIQPSGSITLGVAGSYAFTVVLEASRRGNDQDGRHYTIAVSAKDNIGNPGFKSTIVTVPHDQGQPASASLTACGRICK